MTACATLGGGAFRARLTTVCGAWEMHMAAIEKDGKGWRIRFLDSRGNRKTIRFSKENKQTVEKIRLHIEALVNNRQHNVGLERSTLEWLSGIGKLVREKLVRAGLIDESKVVQLGPFLDGYRSKRSDAKDSTHKKYESVSNVLIAHFGRSKDIRAITRGDADDFRSFLYGKGLSENTVRRYCGVAKQFFTAALRRNLIDKNPFEDQVCSVRGNAEKFHFVSEADAKKILEKCPDIQWRVIFALCRWGGLRCPSEVLSLQWSDVQWEANRLRVPSPKTEHHEGKGSRLIPLFPEVRAELDKAYAEAFDSRSSDDEVVSGPIVIRYRDSTQNLRTTFQKIVLRSGLKPWPKLFQNLRSTRQTELAEKYPVQAVTSWIGNSAAVAMAHYLQVRDEYFDQAVGVGQSVGAPAVAEAISDAQVSA